jgi:hypothetical protein
VSHTLTTYLLLGYFNTATLADTSFLTDSLILSAMALVILDRTEDALTEQTVTFRFVGTIVDGLGFEYLSA